MFRRVVPKALCAAKLGFPRRIPGGAGTMCYTHQTQLRHCSSASSTPSVPFDDGEDAMMAAMMMADPAAVEDELKAPAFDPPLAGGSKYETLIDRESGDASKLWGTFFNNEGKDTPPSWFQQLCEDLHFRRGSEEFDTAARENPVGSFDARGAPLLGSNFPQKLGMNADTIEKGTQKDDGGALIPPNLSDPAKPTELEEEAGMDPYLYLNFDLRDEAQYEVGRFDFDSPTANGIGKIFNTMEERAKMCLGERQREYVCFCDAYSFPDRRQIPTAVGTIPTKLWVDPSVAIPTVFIQLAPEFPPAMWLPVKATAAAVRRVLSEFAAMAASHRDEHHLDWEEKIHQAKGHLQMHNMPQDAGHVLRYLGKMARETRFDKAPVREYRNFQTLFLGEHAQPEALLEYMDSCPYFFAVPHMRNVVDLYSEENTPTIEGPGIASSLYRCVHSKALIMIEVHLATEVKLPPQDPEAFALLWKDVDQNKLPPSRVPIFAKVIWPDNKRMCGGGVVARFNKLMGREFAAQMPVDAAMALHFLMLWAGRSHDLLGVEGMRERLKQLEAAYENGTDDPGKALTADSWAEETADERERFLANTAALGDYPSTRDIPNPAYSIDERLGMHIQYLAHVGDPQAKDVVLKHLHTGSAAVRCGCAKAALELNDMALFRSIVSTEPPGRMQHYLTKLVRKRKTRDLTDAVPRLLDEQYEFAAPLWTGRGRLDPQTLEGQIDIHRLRTTGKLH